MIVTGEERHLDLFDDEDLRELVVGMDDAAIDDVLGSGARIRSFDQLGELLEDAFDLPLLFLQDVPGFMVGSKVEQQGIIRHGAKMLYAVATATVPKLTVVLRKGYGAGYYVMNGRAYEPDLLVAWPGAEISVMGAEGIVAIAASKLLAQSPEPEAMKQQLSDAVRPHIDIRRTAALGLVDEVIDPRETRPLLAHYLRLTEHKKVERPWRKRGISPV